jgi:hypothetical protein
MEYSECLDAASSEPDSLKRLAFVAGFAMSNYASTIGRIAKPFNPMLSETFELVNLDRKYRYGQSHPLRAIYLDAYTNCLSCF